MSTAIVASSLYKSLRVTPAMAAGLIDKLMDMSDIVRMIDAYEARMGKKPKATYRVIPVKEGGFAVEVTPKDGILHNEFGFKSEDEARAWIETKRARNSN